MRNFNPLAYALCCVAWASLAGCVRSPVPGRSTAYESAATESVAPSVGAPRSVGTNLDLSRVAYAMRSAEPLLMRWGWVAQPEPCVLLIEPQGLYAIGCQAAPDGAFINTGSTLLDAPVFHAARDHVRLGGQDVPLAAFVQAVPATAIVPHAGAEPGTIGSDRPWVAVASLDALIAHHPGFSETTSTEEWLATFVHELFHTYQLSQPAFAATAAQIFSGGLSPTALIEIYEKDEAYRSSVQEEYALLSEAAGEPSLGAARALETLTRWRMLYSTRIAKLREREQGETLARADEAFTYVEGAARYAESVLLTDPAAHPQDGLEGDDHFHRFREHESLGYRGMPNRKMGNRYFYAIGMHLGLLLDVASPEWRTSCIQDPKGIVGVVLRLTES